MLHRHVSEAFLIIIMVIRIIEQHSGVFKTFAINLTYYYSNAITYLNALLLRGVLYVHGTKSSFFLNPRQIRSDTTHIARRVIILCMIQHRQVATSFRIPRFWWTSDMRRRIFKEVYIFAGFNLFYCEFATSLQYWIFFSVKNKISSPLSEYIARCLLCIFTFLLPRFDNFFSIHNFDVY